jgi:hypothetical protein
MATQRPRRHGKEVLHDIDSEDDPHFPASSSTNRQQHPSRVATAVPPRYWLEGAVEGVWVVLVVALGVWVLVAWTVAGQGGAGACKTALHTAGRATFDLVCATSPRQHRPAGRWAGPTTQLLAAASSYLPRFAREWVRDHASAAAGHEQWCPLTRSVVTQGRPSLAIHLGTQPS